jgi:hypothetical protein
MINILDEIKKLNKGLEEIGKIKTELKDSVEKLNNEKIKLLTEASDEINKRVDKISEIIEEFETEETDCGQVFYRVEGSLRLQQLMESFFNCVKQKGSIYMLERLTATEQQIMK